jgi:yecA family protein
MENDSPQNGSIDLGALDDYLMSDHAPDDCMGLSDLDGFLTGVVVGPKLILPSEWLPVIWGDQEPESATEAEMHLGTIMGRYNEIAAASLAIERNLTRSSGRGRKVR